MDATPASGLFGIFHSNRKPDEHWSKNRFNSSFPCAVANYMMAHDIPATYVKLAKTRDGQLVTRSEPVRLQDVYRCGNRPLDALNFAFESIYEPYQKYAYDKIDGIDLVVKDTNGTYLAPLEVKLTVMPNNTTASRPPDEWGCEVIIRSATTSYCAFGMFDGAKKDAATIRKIFEPVCASIGDWGSNYEMTHKTAEICLALDAFEAHFYRRQRPLVLQPVWKTEGQSPILSDDAFGLIVWSDYAFSRLFIDPSKRMPPSENMTRAMRASVRLTRTLWELHTTGKINRGDIYRQMAYNIQTDKELSIQGPLWRKYVNDKHVERLPIPKTALKDIIAPGFLEKLRPERRFDQTLYFTMRS